MGVSLGADCRVNCRTYIRMFAAFWIRTVLHAAVTLWVRAVATGAIRLRLLWVGIGQSFSNLGLELLAHLLVVIQQFASVLLRPFAGGSEYEAGDGVEFVGDGAESEAPGLEGNGAASGGDVKDYWSRLTGELQNSFAQTFELAVGGVMGEGTAIFITKFVVFALLAGIRHTLLVVVNARVGSQHGKELIPTEISREHGCGHGSA